MAPGSGKLMNTPMLGQVDVGFCLGDWICISMKEPGKSRYHLVPHLYAHLYVACTWVIDHLPSGV